MEHNYDPNDLPFGYDRTDPVDDGWDEVRLKLGMKPKGPRLKPVRGGPVQAVQLSDWEAGRGLSGQVRKLDDPAAIPRPVLIEPFIRLGDLVMLTGEKGQGKSTFIADLVMGCYLDTGADEDHWVGGGALRVDRELLEERNIVILDAENEVGDWKEMVVDAARARDVAVDDERVQEIIKNKVHHLNYEDFSLDPSENPRGHYEAGRALRDLLLELNCGILVIDPLHSVYVRDLYKPEWVQMGLRPLRKELRAVGITTLAITHTSRDSRDKLDKNRYMPAGTSEQEKAADVIIGFNRHIKEGYLKLVLCKRRAAKWNQEYTVATLTLSIADAGYSHATSEWEFEDPRPKEVVSRLTDSEKAIFATIAAAGPEGLHMTAIEADKGYVSKVIRNVLQKAGLVQVVGGTGKRGDPIKWGLSAKGAKYLKGS